MSSRVLPLRYPNGVSNIASTNKVLANLTQAFVVQIADLKAAIYWAEFPQSYLETIRTQNLSNVNSFPKIPLRHTRPKSLLDHEQRNVFLLEFIALIRFIVDGQANTGLLRRYPETSIHRDVEEALAVEILDDV